MSNSTRSVQRVCTTNVTQVDDLLTLAVERVIPDALALKQGIKVTRVGPGEYLVETAPEVPCGYTICEPH
jgi:hypothetical protein